MTLLSEAALSRVKSRIEAIERGTAGEIVVAIVPRSDGYHGPRALSALALAVLGGSLWPWLFDDAYGLAWLVESSLLVELLLGVFGYWLSGLPPLLRWIVPGATVDQAVRQLALSAFVERGVHHTRDASGVLVFLSEAEHAAVVLGDRGIHQRLGEPGWQAALERLLAALKRGEGEAGLLALLDELGAVLTREFPTRPDDRNELPDAVVRGPGR